MRIYTLLFFLLTSCTHNKEPARRVMYDSPPIPPSMHNDPKAIAYYLSCHTKAYYYNIEDIPDTPEHNYNKSLNRNKYNLK